MAPKAWGEAGGDPPLPTTARGSWFPKNVECELEKFRTELRKLRPTPGGSTEAQIPVHCLRWTHDAINSRMIFSGGRGEDSSIYSMAHDLFTGRLEPGDVPPLQVVMDGDVLFSLNNRRLAALKMCQALSGHKVLKVPCIIFHKDHRDICAWYRKAKSTSEELGHGHGVKAHGERPEAWHLGEPLFRREGEWFSAMQPGSGSTRMQEAPREVRRESRKAQGASASENHGGLDSEWTSSLSEATAPPSLDQLTKDLRGQEPGSPNAPQSAPSSPSFSSSPVPPVPLAEEPNAAGLEAEDASSFPPLTLSPKAERPQVQSAWTRRLRLEKDHGVSTTTTPAASGVPPTPPPREPPQLQLAAESLTHATQPAASLAQPPMQPPVPQPAAPAVQPAAQPAAKPAEKPAAKPAAQPAAQAAEQQAAQPPPQSPSNAAGSETTRMKESALKGPQELTAPAAPSEAVPDMFEDDLGSDSFRSLSEDDELDSEVAEEEEPEPASAEAEKLEKLLSEMQQQADVVTVGDLKDRLVSGTFRVLSGSDFRNRRSRAQIIVDQGPPSMVGRRVHVIGAMNRNQAWDHDRCWVRVLAARVEVEDGQAPRRQRTTEDLKRPWDPATAEATVLFGQVRHAVQQLSPRQSKVVCVRSRLVRSLKSMCFRPINGKFPLITVPWNPLKPPPELHDLHVVDLQCWKNQLPMGCHEEVLHMQSRDSDETVLYAIKRSLNFCDWEDHSVLSSIPIGAVQHQELLQRSRRRQDLRHQLAVCIEQPGWPGNLALSLTEEALQVHVLDVSAYMANDMSGKDLELQARSRACSAWLADHLDRPSSASLPLLQPEFIDKVGFADAAERLALTFTIPRDPRAPPMSIEHCESIVRCHQRLSYVEAEQSIAGGGGCEDVASLLRGLSLFTEQLEAAALQSGESFPLEHWDPQVGLRDPLAAATLRARRIVGCCSFLVNRYAGYVLSDVALWHGFLQDQADKPSMPCWVFAKPDAQNHRSLHRLLRQHSGSVSAGISTREVLEALSSALDQDRLTGVQQYALQKAFLRQIRMALPGGFYRCQAAVEEAKRPRQLFQRPRIFHVSAPLDRYIDILGQRLLKRLKGWQPGVGETWLRPTVQQIRETVDRTNARLDGLRFAGFIYRQICMMRDLRCSSKRVPNAVVGFVGPSMFEVLVPLASSAHVSLQVPTSALRSLTSSLEFDTEMQCLRVVNTDPWRKSGMRARWSIEPWGATRVEVTVSRNFAQPIDHHAAANAMIVSNIVFDTCSGAVDMGIGHRMYPEVFSEFPDLKDCHLMETQLHAYATTWSKIWRCRTHAGAAAAAAYSQPLQPSRLQLLEGAFECNVLLGSEEIRFEKGDLAILRCVEGDREVLLYGLVEEFQPAKTQYKVKPCNRGAHCSRQNCDFLHPGEEVQEALFTLRVQLSEVSALAQRHQGEALLGALRRLGSAALHLQLVGIPVVDRQNLNLVKQLPEKLRTRQGRAEASPVAAHLTQFRAPNVEQEDREKRPLASIAQVERAIRHGQYQVTGTSINELQLAGLQCGLQHDFSVIQGPPGTGKTTFLVHLVTALANLELDPTLPRFRAENARSGSSRPAAQERTGRILVTTPSNQAADECLRKLVKDTTIPRQYITRVYARTIEYKYGSKLKGDPLDSGISRTEHKVADDLQPYSLHFKVINSQEVQRVEGRPQGDYDQAYEAREQAILEKTKIVITTCSSALSHGALKEAPKPDKKRGPGLTFRSVIVDECAQATEPEVVLPLLRAQDRAILIGDHKQLGPVVTEHNLCKAYLVMLERPILERLANRRPDRDTGPTRSFASTMLEKQYRMHDTICSFPSKHFYDNRLQNAQGLSLKPPVPSVWPSKTDRVVWYDCSHPHRLGSVISVGNARSLNTTVLENNTSLQNEGEADIIIKVYRKLMESGHCRAEDVAIVTPYKAQEQHIQRRLKELPGSLGKSAGMTAVGTVFSMQGSERHYILLSFVRSTAEGWALSHLSMQGSAHELRVSVSQQNPGLRQTFESHIGIAGKATLLNVALTRAKSGLVIVANRTILSEGSEDFYQLATDLEARGCFVPEGCC